MVWIQWLVLKDLETWLETCSADMMWTRLEWRETWLGLDLIMFGSLLSALLLCFKNEWILSLQITAGAIVNSLHEHVGVKELKPLNASLHFLTVHLLYAFSHQCQTLHVDKLPLSLQNVWEVEVKGILVICNSMSSRRNWGSEQPLHLQTLISQSPKHCTCSTVSPFPHLSEHPVLFRIALPHKQLSLRHWATLGVLEDLHLISPPFRLKEDYVINCPLSPEKGGGTKIET